MTSFEIKEDSAMDVQSDIKEWRKDSYLEYLVETPMDPKLHRPCKSNVLTTTMDSKAHTLLKELMREGFQSAPVLGGVSKRQFVTFVDLLDIITWITQLFTTSDVAEWKTFFLEKQDWKTATIEKILEGKTTSPWSYKSPDLVYENSSTFHAMEIMNTHNAHRVAVVNNVLDRRLKNIFTQSMAISELRQRQHLVATLLDKKVREFTHFFKKVISIRDTESAINGFKKMVNENVTGVAVVDEHGKLDGALTTTDLKGLGADMEHMHMLFKPVKEFKAHVRGVIDSIAPRAHYSVKTPPVVPVTVSPDDTMQSVLNKMDDGNLHRVFVCTADSIKDGAPVCTDVITQGDFISAILNHYAFKAI